MKISSGIILPMLLFATVSAAEDSLQDLDVEHFQVKIKPGTPIPTGHVYSDDPSKIKYNKSRPEALPYTVEVRGRCPSASSKLVQFQLKSNNHVILTIPVSGKNRSLTGNNGKQWQAHDININLPANQNSIIQACNALAAQKTQTQSHDEVFNSNFQTEAVDSGQTVAVSFECFGGLGYTDWHYDTAELPLKALCEATGYQSILRVTESQLSLNPINGRDGTCKLNISGGFQTNYELYALRSNQSTVNLKYRFKYHGAGQAANTAYSQWWKKTTNPVNGGAFVFNYTDRLPTNINGGKISLEVMINGKLNKSAPKPFSISCVDTLPLQQVQTHQLSLSVRADKTELVPVAGQLCPTHAVISAEMIAGTPINGKMVIIGSSLVDIYSRDISSAAGGSVSWQKRVKLSWPTGITNTLTLNGAETASDELKTQTLNYELRLLNSANALVKKLAKLPYTISCVLPSVNPGPAGNADSLTVGGTPPGHKTRPNKTTTAGLKSDGELVQAGASHNTLVNHESHHAPQQGRILVDADLNTQNQAKQKYSIPMTKTTVSSIRAEQLNRKDKTTLVKTMIGSPCNRNKFPKNAAIKQFGRQYVAKCINNKVQIIRTEKVQRQWKPGDPILTTSQIGKTNEKKKGNNEFHDAMPDDLPAGYKKQNQRDSFKRVQ